MWEGERRPTGSEARAGVGWTLALETPDTGGLEDEPRNKLDTHKPPSPPSATAQARIDWPAMRVPPERAASAGFNQRRRWSC